MRGSQAGQRLYFQPGLKRHHQRYNIDEPTRRKFKVALTTLREHDEPIRIALAEAGLSEMYGPICTALSRIVHGEGGEFK